MEPIKSALAKQIVGTIYDDVVKYYGLYGFVKYKIKSLKVKPIHITRCEDFWSLILRDHYKGEYDKNLKILSGQPLTFSDNFYLSEWAPKMPGKIWTKSAQEKIDELPFHQMLDHKWKSNEKFEIIFDEVGKKKAIEAGYGSVRINPSKNPKETFMYMSLTTPENWNVDLAIPVIVSKSVFEEYRRKSENKGAVEIGKLEGILIIDLDLPIKETISNAIGAKVDENLVDLQTKQPLLPKCFVYIPSILGVDFKYNNSHPECRAWTVYKKNVDTDLQKNFNQKVDFEYGVTYAEFNPTNTDTLIEALEFIKRYARYNDGTELITDFDGMEPKFESRLTITSNPDPHQKKIYEVTLKEIEKFGRSIP